MGSKTQGKKSSCDYYKTPIPLVKLGIDLALKRYARINNIGSSNDVEIRTLSFLDPGCGPDARFARKAYEIGFCNVVGIDTQYRELDEKLFNFSYFQQNYLTEELQDFKSFDVICGNPPFSNAEQFIRRSFHLLRGNGVLCFLLRVGFWESSTRIKFYKDPRNKPAETMILQQRPSFFTENGIGPTDGTAYAFFIWDGEIVNRVLRGEGVRPVIDCISWR